MNDELIERLRMTEQMLNAAHFTEAESLIREARNAIEELQSKLTVLRLLKKGKWIKRGPNFYTCSECASFSSERENFCPGCGADMREEKTNETN